MLIDEFSKDIVKELDKLSVYRLKANEIKEMEKKLEAKLNEGEVQKAIHEIEKRN